jgi:hypothetical protein
MDGGLRIVEALALGIEFVAVIVDEADPVDFHVRIYFSCLIFKLDFFNDLVGC